MSIGNIDEIAVRNELRKQDDRIRRLEGQISKTVTNSSVSAYHSQLLGLSYADSGHTGFSSAADLTTHTGDLTIHFTEASINHTDIQNIGTNSHATIDTHLASTSNPHTTTWQQALTASATATSEPLCAESLSVGTNPATNGYLRLYGLAGALAARRSGTIEWYKGEAGTTQTITGYTHTNSANDFVWNDNAPTSRSDQGVARVNFGTGSAVFGGSLTVGTDLTISDGSFAWTDANDTAVGCTLAPLHDSASPAAGDLIFWLSATAKNSSDTLQEYAGVYFKIRSPTGGAEYGEIQLAASVNNNATGIAAAVGASSPSFTLETGTRLEFDGTVAFASGSTTTQGDTAVWYDSGDSRLKFQVNNAAAGKRLEIDGNGDVYGTRESFTFHESVGPVTASRYITVSGVDSVDAGYDMPRAGSVVSVSLRCRETLGAGTSILAAAQIDGSTVLETATVSTASAGWKTVRVTQARGIDTFAAGAQLNARVTLVGGNISGIYITIGVVFD